MFWYETFCMSESFSLLKQNLGKLIYAIPSASASGHGLIPELESKSKLLLILSSKLARMVPLGILKDLKDFDAVL